MSGTKIYKKLIPGTIDPHLIDSDNVFDKSKNISQKQLTDSIIKRVVELEKLDPNLKLQGIGTGLPTENIVYFGIYAVGPKYDEDDINQEYPLYKLYTHNKVNWVYLGYLNSSTVDISSEMGDSTSLTMSQKAIKDNFIASGTIRNIDTSHTQEEIEQMIMNGTYDENTLYLAFDE